MNLDRLREFTPARVAQGRTGDSLPTRELLEFQLAHARARDAVHAVLDVHALRLELATESIVARSAVSDRATYLRRPDLGRVLSQESRALLAERRGEYEVTFVVADGLSALAVQRHAAPLLGNLRAQLDPAGWRIAPVVLVEQGRVAIGDEVGAALGSAMVVVLIGERPGLSSPDSLGVYLTWKPRPELSDADRNCISNIRAGGLSYAAATHKLMFLMTEARRRKLSGVTLKDETGLLT